MAAVAEDIKSGIGAGLGAPLLLITMLGMMMLPIPPIFLDFFFADQPPSKRYSGGNGPESEKTGTAGSRQDGNDQ